MNRPSFSVPRTIGSTRVGDVYRNGDYCAPALNLLRLHRTVTSSVRGGCNIGCSPGARVVMAMNIDRTLCAAVAAVVRPNSRVVLPRPYCITGGTYIVLTNNGPISMRACRRGNFIPAVRSLRGTIAPGAGTVVLNCPGGPANTVVDGRRVGTVNS